MEMQASDLSARLLATENISVIRARTRTASFDIQSRLLTLPMWKEMTPEIEEMLIGHEVGHALYTTEEYSDTIKENTKIHSYLNIIEDVRIEKLIKRKYPGIRKRMNEGYKQLNDRDFFGVKTIQNFDDLLLIDKINLYFKVGYNCGVTFTPDEREFVNRAERCETIQEVIDLAKDIFAYSKEKAEQQKEAAKMSMKSGDSPDGDYEDSETDYDSDMDPDSDDFGDDEKPKGSTSAPKKNEEDKEDDLGSKTERNFQNRLEDLADESTQYNYWEFDTDYFEEPVIGFKKILNDTKTPEQWADKENYIDYRTRYMEEEQRKKFLADEIKEFENFKIETSRTVNYLVKEFEMKKSAQMHKRAQTSKLGSLDMRKVYAYKLKDDLFKRITSLPQGKNHGMVMLVDWSGSMQNVLQDTLKQVISLAQFCNRVQIPYRVYAFTTCYEPPVRPNAEQAAERYDRRMKHSAIKAAREGKFIDASRNFHLLELFSSKMSMVEFNSMCKRVVDFRFTQNTGYSTGGTPLNEALVWVYQNLGSFIKNNNIEKTTFITLTDGEGGSFSTNLGSGSEALLDVQVEIVNNVYKRVRHKHFIKDKTTQKTYEIFRDSTRQTDMVLRMIKDRYNVSIVGFHICRNARRDLHSVITSNIPNYSGDSYLLIENWRKEFRNNNFVSVKNTARDELFIIPQNSTKIVDGDLEIENNSNAKSIAKNFSKYLNTKRTSRILLNRFVDLVA